MKALVAYYSLSGNTEKVAKAIAEALSADIEPIRDAKPRHGAAGVLRSVWEAVFKLKPKIAPFKYNAADYDLVILGAPVWAQNMASPMRTFFAAERGRIKQVALFCTLGGAGADQALKQMADLAGGRLIARLAVSEAELKSGEYRTGIEAFVQKVRNAETPDRVNADAA